MGFTVTANRKLIALIFFSILYINLFASVELSKSGELPLRKTGLSLNGRLFNDMYAPVWGENKQINNSTDIPSKTNIGVPKRKKSTRLPIDGPGQPEMSSFRPAGMDNMVDLFTGDFSYNIPLLDVGGYPVNLFYNGGISMDQEASWVGLGFNINPGTISRNMRGLPDDFKGDLVKKEMNVKNDLTVGVNIGKVIEKFGFPKSDKFKVSGKMSLGLFYNNYRGVGLEAGVSPQVSFAKYNVTEYTNFKDTTAIIDKTAGVNLNLNSQSGLNASPYVNYVKREKEMTTSLGASINYNSRQGLQSIQMDYSEMRQHQNPTQRLISQWIPGLSANISFAKSAVMPSIRMPMENFNGNLSIRFSKNYKKGFLLNGTTLGGYVTNNALQDNIKISKSYGYMNLSDATDKDALMDFNRLNDVPYIEANPIMAFPAYTYDVFSISGEGTGGSFRAYRSDIGYVRDQFVKSKNGAISLGLAFDKGSTDDFKVDVDLAPVYSPTVVGEWDRFNQAKEVLHFTNSNQKYQSVYFKNPAEKTIIDKNYYESIGGDDMVRLKMENMIFHAQLKPILQSFDNKSKTFKQNLPINSNTLKINRDKRSQVITVLTAQEASIVGLTKSIEYYPVNQFPRGDCDPNKKTFPRSEQGSAAQRKSHHISEVTVLQGDGKRYVYSIPAYNFIQEDVSFNAEGNPVSNTLIQYTPGVDNTTNNKKGTDNFFQMETMPSYAHSYMLSGLLSPDYVDIKGDGITEDDLGNAIKFNYSKVFSGSLDYIKWRLPLTDGGTYANHSPGLVTDKFDDKAHYSYGEKELWYLNSIESKTMIATFKIDPLRHDGREASGRNGALGSGGSYILREINLYSKAEFKINGTASKPIKTVHFDYDYSLCPGAPGNGTTGEGKLTLKKIWFSYGGNDRHTFKNAYRFSYNNNKVYNRANNDRWGNYKNAAHNPGGLSNDQFPYVSQTEAASTDETAPWQLKQVILPSGGKVNITYESDDYAYVQNRRAAAMFSIVGFSKDKAGHNNELYNFDLTGYHDKFYVLVKANSTLPASFTEAKKAIKDLYLTNINQLYMKLAVKVPKDQYGQGYEPIGFYVDITDYEPAQDRDYFWIKIGEVNNLRVRPWIILYSLQKIT